MKATRVALLRPGSHARTRLKTLIPLLALLLLPALGFTFTDPNQTLANQATVDLLQYARSAVNDQDWATIPRYNRNKHFGRWINADPEKDCFDTRHEVLERDADKSVPLEIKQKSAEVCLIQKGLWHDPYTGEDRTDARDIQIDHVVALRNAYYSGGYAWTPARRCHYANYLDNSFHLSAVDGPQNEIKSDKTPEFYMPPNAAFRCQYLKNWMSIKAVWKLATTSSEVNAIERLAKGCDTSELTISSQELLQQQQLSTQPTQACIRFEDHKNSVDDKDTNDIEDDVEDFANDTVVNDVISPAPTATLEQPLGL